MKKLISLLLAMTMLFAFTACSNSANTAVPDNSNTSTPENVTTDDTANNTDDAQANTTQSVLSIGQTLLNDFKQRVTKNFKDTAESVAKALTENTAIEFSPMYQKIEPGVLTGFGNTEITGFKEGAMFSPMVGTIPFVGYIFVLEDGTDVEEFKQMLKDNADPAWNICTSADETIVESVDNVVFFLMSPVDTEE